MQIVPGITIGGKYRIERLLARGGMGSVWVARHAKLGSMVAVKFLSADLARDSGGIARFEREARAAATLDTPHVVRVHDYGVEDGTPYLVMELLQGEDLNMRLRKRGRLTLAETLKIVTQIGRALRRAHQAGIVHRDLKPANIYLARVEDEEIVKILDFGIAKETWRRVEESTLTGEVMGSPHYMSPEQSRAQRTVDHRSDVWAAGVITYRLSTGRLPFPGDVLGEILSAVLVDTQPSVKDVAPDLPPELDAFFARALAKKKEERFQSIDELVEALTALANRAGVGPNATGAHAAIRELPPPSVGAVERTPLPLPLPPLAPVPPSAAASLPATVPASAAPPGPPLRVPPAPPPRPPAASEPEFIEAELVLDTTARTLPYRPSVGPAPADPGAAFPPPFPPPPEPFSAALRGDAQMPVGKTGPTHHTTTQSLLPPELRPRRARKIAVVAGLAVSAAAVVIGLALASSSPDAQTVSGTPSAETAAPPAAAPELTASAQPPGDSSATPPPSASAPATTEAAGSAAPKGAVAPGATARAAASNTASPKSTATTKKPPGKKTGPTDSQWGL